MYICTCTYIAYICIHIYICAKDLIYIYIHISIERERERDICVYVDVYVYIHLFLCLYIYIYIHALSLSGTLSSCATFLDPFLLQVSSSINLRTETSEPLQQPVEMTISRSRPAVSSPAFARLRLFQKSLEQAALAKFDAFCLARTRRQ